MPVIPAIESKINAELKGDVRFLVKLEKYNNERTDKLDESVSFVLIRLR